MMLRKLHLLVLVLALTTAAVESGYAESRGSTLSYAWIQDAEDHASEQDAGEHTAPQDAAEHATPQDAGEHATVEKLDPVHHNSDSNYLDFEPMGKLELPRIFLVRREDGAMGLDVYRSTVAAMEFGGYTAHLEEGVHGTYLDAKMVPPSGGEVIIDFSITKHLVFAWLAMLIVLLIFVSLGRKYQSGVGRDSPPKGLFQNMMETMVVFVRDDIARPNLGPKTDKYLPYLLTAFFFILTSNLLGLIPYAATPTSNIMVTAVLASFTFIITQLGGTKDYWRHVFWPPGIPIMVKPILMPVEILGLFTKPFALAIRLFANMTAGHLVILSLIGLIFTFGQLFGSVGGYGVAPVSVAFALFIYFLELLVALIQAYVFTMLSALFIGMAVQEHDHAETPVASSNSEPEVVADSTGHGVSSVEQPEPALA